MKINKLEIKTQSKTYSIYIGEKILNLTGRLINKKLPRVKKISVICDKKLPLNLLKKLKTSLKKYDVKIHQISAGEKVKTFKFANVLIEIYFRKHIIFFARFVST